MLSGNSPCPVRADKPDFRTTLRSRDTGGAARAVQCGALSVPSKLGAPRVFIRAIFEGFYGLRGHPPCSLPKSRRLPLTPQYRVPRVKKRFRSPRANVACAYRLAQRALGLTP